MEEKRFTPGPWHIKPVKAATVEGDLNITQTGSATGKGYHIGYATTWTDSEETKNEAQANAWLIVAAPELLEALQSLVHADTHGIKNCTAQVSAIEKARAAIAKALGKE